MLSLGLGAMAACSSDDVSTPSRPPLGSVRFINAVADTGAVDINAVDQVEYAGGVKNLNFKAGTEYQQVEAKARHFRVFANSRNINVSSTPIMDTTINVEANARVTWLLTGSARAKTLKFVVISDDASAPAAGMIAVRLVNASSGAVNGYLVSAADAPIADPAAASNVAVLAQSPYVVRTAGNAAVRVTDVGSPTINASAAGPVASVVAGENAAAGVNSAGTKFSVYYFPRGVLGSPQNAQANPAAIWFVDRNPSDTQ
jgi:hypothetical protein